MSQTRKPEQVAFWRVPRFRAWIYQAVAIGLLVLAGLVIYQNTMENLSLRGIKTGFSFLGSEAGFAIGETMPLFLLQGKFLGFLALLLGMTGLFRLMGRAANARGIRIRDRRDLSAVAILLLIVIPGIYLYLYGGSFPVIAYHESSSYLAALFTGLVNTLLVSVIACVLSTILGLFVALARLSPNWLLSRLARWYVEINRNIPLLMQLFFWYFIVFQGLPGIRQSITFGKAVFLNNRGLYIPRPLPLDGAAPFFAAVVLAFILVFFWHQHVSRVQDETGRQLPVLWPALFMVMAIPALSCLVFGAPFSFELPVAGRFNLKGGMTLTPEFVSLVTGLTIYVSAFNAEIIRGGIQSVSKGQREAAKALSFSDARSMRLVILPQALRVIVPPMINEYLAVTKNSSLAVAIGYPDLVSVGGTILNQTGQAIEVIGIWMGVYLILSLLISLGMNWYNAKIRLVER